MPSLLCRGLAAIIICASALPASASIVNGGFETGLLTPWFQDRNFAVGAFEDWNVTSADARSGTYSATNTNNVELRQDFDPVATTKITEFSFWAKHVGVGSAMAYTFFYNDGSSDQSSVSVPEDAWLFFDVTDALDAGKLLVGFSVFGNSSGCPGAECTRTYLDDVRVSMVPVPAALPLLAGALAGLGLLRRRLRG